MLQQHLPTLAPEALVLQADYVGGSGWHLQIAIRAQFERWGDSTWTHYGGLTTEEMLQTIEDHLSSRL